MILWETSARMIQGGLHTEYSDISEVTFMVLITINTFGVTDLPRKFDSVMCPIIFGAYYIMKNAQVAIKV